MYKYYSYCPKPKIKNGQGFALVCHVKFYVLRVNTSYGGVLDR